MEKKPGNLMSKLLGYAAIFALITFLLKLGVTYLKEIWWILLIIVVITIAGIFLYRRWRNNHWE